MKLQFKRSSMLSLLLALCLLTACAAPAAPNNSDTSTTEPELSCTLSISCAAILTDMDKLDPKKTELVPQDGWLLPPTSVTFSAEESVFDVLQRTCRDQNIHLEFVNTPAYNSTYIQGIGNLYESDCGGMSGWLYTVNGESPSVGCNSYLLTDGDVVEWSYSVDLMADMGMDCAQ